MWWSWVVACRSDSDAVLRVVDEAGTPRADAVVHAGDERFEADEAGEVRLSLDRPMALVVEAPGALSEPVVLGADDRGQRVEVTLLDDADGRRTVLHFTGDVMIGRRYQSPTEGPALVPAGDRDAARALVSDAAPWLSLADLTLVNLETVVGEAPADQAYPGKRWLLQTPPDALAALDELGADLAILANNHQRDWMDDGVVGTLAALGAEELPAVGAALDEVDAARGATLTTAGGTRVGVLAWTSVDGDFVNDAYPGDDLPEPDGLSEAERWTWVPRSWGEPELGVPVAERRIGGAWRVITELEEGLSDGDRAALWASASVVYPELQDWVARRGHGGAARWDEHGSVATIERLRPDVDLLVVQLHMGYQFASVAGSGTRAAARAAIDAGADIVVCHHPHVLQGVEWYHGKLIAYSLGNFVFDQDFLSTFRSAFLRTVWEDGALVQARIVPMFLDAYRPVPSADELATGTLRALWDGSLLAATADRGEDLGVRAVVDPSLRSDVRFRLEHHTAVLEQGWPEEQELTVDVPCEGAVSLPRDVLIRLPIDGTPGLRVGRELDLLGSFEDQDADGAVGDPVGWTWTSSDITVGGDHFGDDHALRLVRRAESTERVSARMRARVAMPEHRVWADREGDAAADGVASYSVLLSADRAEAPAPASVRLALYHFDDLDPTEDPESVLLREVELPFEAGRRRSELLLDVPGAALDPVAGLVPNAALLYVSLSPPEHDEAGLRVFDVSLVEWRNAASEPEGFAAIDQLRGGGGGRCGPVTLRVLPM